MKIIGHVPLCDVKLKEHEWQPPYRGTLDSNFLSRLEHYSPQMAILSKLEEKALKEIDVDNEEIKMDIQEEELISEGIENSIEELDEDFVISEEGEESDEDYSGELEPMSLDHSSYKRPRRSTTKKNPDKKPSKDAVEYYLVKTTRKKQDLKDFICRFCGSKEGVNNQCGPFVKKSEYDMKHLSEERVYFHKDCLIYNRFVEWDDAEERWKGIEYSLRHLQIEATPCYRCGKSGTTIKCKWCGNWFHGFRCCRKGGVIVGKESDFDFYCLLCYNNYIISKISNKGKIKDSTLRKYQAKFERQWMRKALVHSQEFLPQLGDEVYYFFQGHEDFIAECPALFCSGKAELPPQLPWKMYPELYSPTLCKITGVSFQFPSPVSLVYLFKHICPPKPHY